VTEQTDQSINDSAISDFGVKLPPNSRVKTLLFDDAAKHIRVTLDDDETEVIVPIERIRALHGARVRHESVAQFKELNPAATASVQFVAKATLTPVRKDVSKGAVTVIKEELLYAFAIRVDGVESLWYIMAASFNFRKTLGPLATYSTDLNVKEFVKRFASFAPHAVCDSFFTGVTKSLPLPPPVDTLIEFFRVAAR
jgi:hypothetical protein